VKKRATINSVDFQWRPWHHDSIIREKQRLWGVGKYIQENSMKWNQAMENLKFPHHKQLHNILGPYL